MSGVVTVTEWVVWLAGSRSRRSFLDHLTRRVGLCGPVALARRRKRRRQWLWLDGWLWLWLEGWLWLGCGRCGCGWVCSVR